MPIDIQHEMDQDILNEISEYTTTIHLHRLFDSKGKGMVIFENTVCAHGGIKNPKDTRLSVVRCHTNVPGYANKWDVY